MSAEFTLIGSSEELWNGLATVKIVTVRFGKPRPAEDTCQNLTHFYLLGFRAYGRLPIFLSGPVLKD
jgi:hypothetical protein